MKEASEWKLIRVHGQLVVRHECRRGKRGVVRGTPISATRCGGCDEEIPKDLLISAMLDLFGV
jgi:hypothetical protein